MHPHERLNKSVTALRNFTANYTPFGIPTSISAEALAAERSQGKVSERCVNLRDCGLVSSSLKPETVYRSSQVVSSRELQCLKLKAVLDLRVMKKPCKKHAHSTLEKARQKDFDLKAMFPPRSDSSSSDSLSDLADEFETAPEILSLLQEKAGTKMCRLCTKEFHRKHDIAVPIYHSDLMPWHMKLRIFKNLPGKTQMRALKEVIKFKSPENLVASAVVDPSVMGPQTLYQLILDHSHAPVARALRIFCSPDNFPALIHCIHGKDRTGLVVMLLLLICDVPPKLVVADYIQSELQLKEGRDKGDLHELDDFLQTDNVIASKAETMVTTISHLEERYGSIIAYCKHIGLDSDEIVAIRYNLMQYPNQEPRSQKDLAERSGEDGGSYHEVNNDPAQNGQKSISFDAFRAAEKAIDEFQGDEEEAHGRIPHSSASQLA